MAIVRPFRRPDVYQPWQDTIDTDLAALEKPRKLAPAGCDNAGRYPARQLPAECCSEVGAEPRGKHRTSWLSAAFLRLSRWLFG